MKKFLYIAMSVIVLSMTMASCEDWMDINTSPDNPVTVSYDVVLPSLLYFATQQVFDHAEYHMYLTQCVTTTGRSPKEGYSYRAGWGGFPDMNRHPHWRRHYYEIGVNCQYMIDDAVKRGARNYALIAHTLQLHSLMITTDEFGDMPVSEAYKSNTPGYDSQSQIYDSLDTYFRQVINMYNDPAWYACPTNAVVTEKTDRLYQGNLDNYRSLTYALYARYWLRRIPNWDLQCCDSVIKYVDLAMGAGWKEPRYKFDGGTGEKTSMWGPYHATQATMNLGWPQGRENGLGGAVPTEFFGSILGFFPGACSLKKTTGVSSTFAIDPRAERMMQPRAGYDSDPVMLRSLKANIGSDVAFNKNYKAEHFPDLFCNTSDSTKAPKRGYRANPYTRDDGYICMITEEELLFAKAEALYWKGQKQESYNTMMQAVQISLDRYASEMTYSEMPAKNADVWKEIFNRVRLNYADFSIAMLMQQKFVALYLQPEQWTDMRRYNYSSSKNGIQYDNTYVYDVKYVPKKRLEDVDKDPEKALKGFFSLDYALERPYNIYQPHFWIEGKDYITGAEFPLTANAWINRLQPDPETEDKYNRDVLEALGAYKNVDYLRRRMIWQEDRGTGAITNKGVGDWNQF